MNLAAVEKLLSETIGLDAEATGGKALEIAVSAELKRTGLADADAYVDRLRRSPVDLDRLIEATVVPETWFFRDSAPFQLLGEQARELWPAAQSRIARVLSAPCSTGEEPYSIAIALLQAGLRPERICIDAVDISVRALETARRAVYGKSSFRDAEYSGWEPYFETTPDGIRVTDEVAGLVRFHRRNLIEQTDWPGPETYHAVFCRNLLIYLNAESKKKVLNWLGRILVPGGLLFCGHSETMLVQQEGYQAVRYPKAFACRKAAPQARASSPGVPRAVKVSLSQPDRACARSAPRASAPPAAALQPLLSLSTRRDGADATGGPDAAPARSAAPCAVDPQQLLRAARESADRGALVEAENLCKEFLKAQAAGVEGHALLGLIHEAGGRLERAEESFTKALYLNPDHYEALIHLSLLYEKKGESTLARRYRQRARRAEALRPKAPGV